MIIKFEAMQLWNFEIVTPYDYKRNATRIIV
jgi:hypothetical protein